MQRPAYLDIQPVSQTGSESLSLETFRALGERCESFRDAARIVPSSERLFSTWEICRYLIPVDPVHLRRVLRQSPDLPQGRDPGAGGAKWFSLEEVLRLKAHFATTGSKRRGYLPYRPEGLPPRVGALTGLQPGAGRTTLCMHLAMAAAQDGYRVLLIDLDPGAALTRWIGGTVEDEWQTVMPLLGRHHAEHLQMLNRLRLERGEPPVPIEADLERALGLRAETLVQPTRWPNVDLIGAAPDLAAADLRIAGWRLQARTWKFWTALAAALGQNGLSGRYDLILFDTAPGLGHLSIAGLSAARILLLPVRSGPEALPGAGRFLSMLSDGFGTLEEAEAQAARAVGGEKPRFSWDAVQAVLNRYDTVRDSAFLASAQAALGPVLWTDQVPDSPFIGPGRAIYDADYRDSNRETYARARAGIDPVYAAFKRVMVDSWHREDLGPG